MVRAGQEELQERRGPTGPVENRQPLGMDQAGAGEQGTRGMRVPSLEGRRPRSGHEGAEVLEHMARSR